MTRLLWKEWGERAVWLLPWALATVIFSALGAGLRACGPDTAPSPWMVLPPMLALLAGLGAYTSEQKGERATFLYSRATSWKQVLAAKVLFGTLAALGITTMAALACRLLLPAFYHPFMTPVNLGYGILEAAGITLFAYLLGLCCSIVLPGLAGGFLAFLLWFGVFLIFMQMDFSLYPEGADTQVIFLPALLFLAPFPAVVLIARFGLTLTATARVLRFALVVGVLAATGLLLDHTPLVGAGRHWLTHQFYPPRNTAVAISPSGKYACVQDYAPVGVFNEWIVRADGRRFPLPSKYRFTWLDGDLLLLADPGRNVNSTLIVCRLDGDQVKTRVFEQTELLNAYPSPDRQRLLMVTHHDIKVFDLTTGEKRVMKNIARLTPAWWESDTAVGYVDPASDVRLVIPLDDVATGSEE